MLHDWKCDPGERARRIYEWWKVRLIANPAGFHFFLEALRRLVLTQVSSAAVERVFSLLKRIVDSCGHNILEDGLEARMMVKCNNEWNGMSTVDGGGA
jgi:hypothetical protein